MRCRPRLKRRVMLAPSRGGAASDRQSLHSAWYLAGSCGAAGAPVVSRRPPTSPVNSKPPLTHSSSAWPAASSTNARNAQTSAERWRPWLTMRSVAPAARRPTKGSRSRSIDIFGGGGGKAWFRECVSWRDSASSNLQARPVGAGAQQLYHEALVAAVPWGPGLLWGSPHSGRAWHFVLHALQQVTRCRRWQACAPFSRLG